MSDVGQQPYMMADMDCLAWSVSHISSGVHGYLAAIIICPEGPTHHPPSLADLLLGGAFHIAKASFSLSTCKSDR